MTLCTDCARETGRHLARFCDPCRARHRGKRPKYQWTEGRLAYLREHYSSRRGMPARVAVALGFPRWVVTRKACELGLTHPTERRPWSEQEEALLLEHLGARTVHWIAKRLNRTLSSVALKIKRLGVSRRITEGYTLRELELCFGVTHHRIRVWVEQGKLPKRLRGTSDGPRDGWMVTDEDLLRFIIEHPLAFDLHRVDQVWFLDLVRGVASRTLRQAEAA